MKYYSLLLLSAVSFVSFAQATDAAVVIEAAKPSIAGKALNALNTVKDVAVVGGKYLAVSGSLVYIYDETVGWQKTEDFIYENGDIVAVATGTVVAAAAGAVYSYGWEVTKNFVADKAAVAHANIGKAAIALTALAATAAILNHTEVGADIKKAAKKVKQYIMAHKGASAAAVTGAALVAGLAYNARLEGTPFYKIFNPTNVVNAAGRASGFVKGGFDKAYNAAYNKTSGWFKKPAPAIKEVTPVAPVAPEVTPVVPVQPEVPVTPVAQS